MWFVLSYFVLKPRTHDQQMLANNCWSTFVGQQLLANICVTHDNILLDNSMAEKADSADDNDVAAAVICLIARKRKAPENCLGAVVDNAKVKWWSIISVVNTRCIRPFCRHDVFYSQPITAHGLPLVGQQKTNKFVNGQHCWPTTFWTHDRLLFANTVGKHMLANICLSCVCPRL